jgi:hypothetical protein
MLHEFDPMTIGIVHHCPSSPWRIFRGGHYCTRNTVERGQGIIQRGNRKSDSSAKRRISFVCQRIQFEYSTCQFSGEVLDASSMSVLVEPQTEARVKGSRTFDVGRTKHNQIEGYVFHFQLHLFPFTRWAIRA